MPYTLGRSQNRVLKHKFMNLCSADHCDADLLKEKELLFHYQDFNTYNSVESADIGRN